MTRDGGAGWAGAPFHLVFDSAPRSRVPRSAAARGASWALRRRPRLPAALFGPARVPHVFRRHAESKRAMALRRFMIRGVTKVRDEWDRTCAGCERGA